MSRFVTRSAFTLVELLVVISILTVLLGLTAIYVVPAFQDNKNVIRGLDRVITVLLIAKQRALRDQRPVGVRFEVDQEGKSRTMRYVEQPDLLSGQRAILTQSSPTVMLPGIDIQGSAAPGDYENYNVQPGDWIRFSTPPPNSSQNMELSRLPNWPPGGVSVFNPPGTTREFGPFSIIRQTRPVPGEDVVELPQNVVVNLDAVVGVNPQYNIPQRFRHLEPPPHNAYLRFFYEIVFSPSGGVFNRYSATPIVLWVHDETKDRSDPATARLIGIYPRTGLVGAHEIAPGTNPLAFALDGKSSGL
ncbi:MAG: prepilin-type N-terminal cleavage/methylation domain-containing protein [Gemmataceae bacterium]